LGVAAHAAGRLARDRALVDSPNQNGLRAVGNGVVKVTDDNRWPMEGIYRVPAGVRRLRFVVWRERVPGRGAAGIAVDDAVLAKISPAGVSSPPTFQRALARYLLPTYTSTWKSLTDVLVVEETYRRYVDVEAFLTTNSALAPLVISFGLLALPLMAVVLLVVAALAGHASRYRSYFFLVLPVVGYCFAELWRTWIFNFGFVHFLLLALLLVPLLDAAVRSLLAYVALRRATG
jgi:hypothetical protein